MNEGPAEYRVWSELDNLWLFVTLNDLLTGQLNKQGFKINRLINWCAFTGLTDRNGLKIYAGDILASTSNTYYEPREVVWFKHESRFGIRADEDEDPLRLNAYYADKEYEVIGNIYDNPELLENKD